MENQNGIEINMIDLFFYLKKKIWVIVAFFLVFTVAGYCVTEFIMTPEYTASTRVIILNRSDETGIVYSDLQLSSMMLSDYTALITGQNVTKEVIAQLGLEESPEDLTKMITVTSPENTRIVQINVTDEDPYRAANIANCVRAIASTQIKELMDVDAVNMVYEADVPIKPSAPSTMMNTVLAAAVGLVVSVTILIFAYMWDDTIRNEEDVERYLGLSVMGVIPASAELRSIEERHGKSARGRQDPRKRATAANAGQKK